MEDLDSKELMLKDMDLHMRTHQAISMMTGSEDWDDWVLSTNDNWSTEQPGQSIFGQSWDCMNESLERAANDDEDGSSLQDLDLDNCHNMMPAMMRVSRACKLKTHGHGHYVMS